jgi:hypothetical protein
MGKLSGQSVLVVDKKRHWALFRAVGPSMRLVGSPVIS